MTKNYPYMDFRSSVSICRAGQHVFGCIKEGTEALDCVTADGEACRFADSPECTMRLWISGQQVAGSAIREEHIEFCSSCQKGHELVLQIQRSVQTGEGVS